ncbi:MAG: TonB-dependent receptor [Alcanivorax sp.]|nr:TonB-dependent receptor [Alcanivorax sp.]
MRTRSLLTLSLLSLTGLTQAATELKTVRVSGADTASLAGELPTGTVILDRQDIAAMPATNLADVLDSVAGLHGSSLYGINGSATSLDLLGFGATANQNTLVLLNGRRLSNIDISSPELAGIPLVAIERIEVLPGAGAALYGNGAVGGVVNIITRRRYDNSAGMEGRAGSYHTLGGGAYATGRSGGVSGALAADTLSGDGYRDNNALRQHNGFADLRYRGEGYSAYLTASGSSQQMGLPGGRNASQFHNDPTGTGTPEDDLEQENAWVMPGLRIDLPGHSALTLDLSRRHQKQQYRYPSLGSKGTTRVDSKSITPKLDGQLDTAGLIHNWTLGLDLHDYDYRSRASFGNRDLQQRQQAWYLHDLVAIGERLSVSAGTRQLNSTLSGDGQRHHQDGEMYEGGLRYTFDGGLAVFAGAQRSVRIANVDELTPFNPPIDPQTAHGYTAGASWAEGRQHSTLTFWRTDVDNEIVFDPVSFTNHNLADPTVHKGISLNSRWDLDQDLALTINGSLQRARFDGGAFDGNRVPLVPESTLQLIADWQALPWLTVQLSHRYVGARYYDGDLNNTIEKLDRYRSSDLQLTARYHVLYLRAGVYNLEDNRISDYGNYSNVSGTRTFYPLPERHYLVTVGMDL